jgi:hypothetical protein
MNFVPKFKGNEDVSPHVKTVIVDDSTKRDQIISLLNSAFIVHPMAEILLMIPLVILT